MLKSLQQNFRRSLLAKDTQDLSIFSSINPDERLNIYRNSVFENLRGSLRIVYPGVWQLLGEECANSMAYALIRSTNNLPTSGCLDDWDAKFPEFLGTKEQLQSLVYIKDYAEFEWLKHLSYSAKNSSYILASDLQAIPDESIGELQFSFVPSMFLYSSCYPIQQIQNIVDNPDAESINLISQQSYALIIRPTTEVLVFWIQADLWLFLKHLQDREPLDLAISKIIDKYQDFNVAQAIGFMLQNCLIKGLNICSSPLSIEK